MGTFKEKFFDFASRLGPNHEHDAHITQLEERLIKLTDRARFYNEYNFSKFEFLEILQELTDLTKSIRRSSP